MRLVLSAQGRAALPTRRSPLLPWGSASVGQQRVALGRSWLLLAGEYRCPPGTLHTTIVVPSLGCWEVMLWSRPQSSKEAKPSECPPHGGDSVSGYLPSRQVSVEVRTKSTLPGAQKVTEVGQGHTAKLSWELCEGVCSMRLLVHSLSPADTAWTVPRACPSRRQTSKVSDAPGAESRRAPLSENVCANYGEPWKTNH